MRIAVVALAALGACLSVAKAQICPDPVLPATCDHGIWDASNPSASIPVVLDLTAALAGTGIALDTVGTPADDSASTGHIDSYSTGIPHPLDGRVMDVEVHGFGQCRDVFAIRNNDNPGHCAGPGPCFELGNTDAVTEPLTAPNVDYGRCLAERDPPSSASEYLLYDYGAMTVKLSTPTSLSFTITLEDIDGHALGAREMGAVFALGRNGQVIHPVTINPGAGQSVKFADILIPEGTAMGMDMSGGPVTISTTEWVGTTPSGTMVGDLPAGPYGPYRDIDHKLGTETETTWEFGGEEVYTLVFVFTYAESPNNEAVAPRINDIKGGILLRMDTPIGCAVPCVDVPNPATTIMKVEGDGSSGKCTPEVRATVGYHYQAGAFRFCSEKYNCNWRATGPVDPVDGLAPCTWTVGPRLQAAV